MTEIVRVLVLERHPQPAVTKQGGCSVLELPDERLVVAKVRVNALGDQPASLVHCGLGFHNLLTENGNLNAVLDWEFTHFGDPGDDLGYIHQFIERVLPWSEFLAMYRAQGGARYTDEQDRFYAVWRSLRNACACMDSYKFYVDDNMPSVKLGTIGLIYGPRFELSGLREVENAVVRGGNTA